MVYVLCTDGPTDVVTGKLEMRILYRGKRDRGRPGAAYDLRPGRWIVDVFVTVPPEASDGVYALELAFKGAGVRFARSETFVVEAREVARAELRVTPVLLDLLDLAEATRERPGRRR